MFKVKIAYLYVNDQGKCQWSQQWVDWNGIDDLTDIVNSYREKEEKILTEMDMDNKVKYAVIIEAQACDDNNYQCASCGLYFAEPENGDCPYCGSGNYVEGCIDDPESNG